jgi:hypothetical protein
VPRSPARPSPLVGKVFRGTAAVQKGLLTRKQLRSSAWLRLRQDVYADADLVLTHRVRTVGVALVLPPGAGIGGRSAAGLWGVEDLAEVADPVEVVLPAGLRWNAGGGVRCRRLLEGRQLERHGPWRCTSRVDTAVDVVRFSAAEEGAAALDHLVREGMIDLEDVRAAAARLPACFGATRARSAVALADGVAESWQESRLRLLMHSAGLPPPVPQYSVRDAYGFVARVDFAYPDLRLAIEYDGLWHGGREAFLSDRRRLDRLTAAGWTVVHVTLDDLHHPARLTARIRAARARRLREPGAR